MGNGLGNRQKNMLQHFIEMKGVNGKPVEKGDVMIEGVNILGAGADTTSTAIVAILRDLVLRPEDFSRLQKEIDGAYEILELTDQEIPYKDAVALDYLAAVIKESMPSIRRFSINYLDIHLTAESLLANITYRNLRRLVSALAP
jgi:hypothetical protein